MVSIIAYVHGCEITCPPCTATTFDTKKYRRHKRDEHNVPFLAFDNSGHAVQPVFDEETKPEVIIMCDHCQIELKTYPPNEVDK